MKKRYILTFPPDSIDEPITWHLIKDFDIKINILNADINAGKEGRLLIEMQSTNSNIRKGIDFIEKQNVEIESIDKRVILKASECIHCGSCTSVCFSGALTMNQDWKLNFNTEKCTVCELCLKACPLGLFDIDF